MGFVAVGSAFSDQLGRSVSSAGDFNNDGFADVIIGAPKSGSDNGVAYLIFGHPQVQGFPELNLASYIGFRIHGDEEELCGFSVSSAGDVNGDGFDDVIIGAFTADLIGRPDVGRVYVIFGYDVDTSIDVDLFLASFVSEAARGFRIIGAPSNLYSGFVVSGAGDLNADGLADVMLSAQSSAPSGAQLTGTVYVIYGRPNSNSYGDMDLFQFVSGPDTGFLVNGVFAYDQVGSSLSNMGDINGDGVDDIIIGLHGAFTYTSAISNSAAFIILGGHGRPTSQPSSQPSNQPSTRPSEQLLYEPTSQPTGQPSQQPSGQPSLQPSVQPSAQPKEIPSRQPSAQPTGQPLKQPSGQPSGALTVQPTAQPSHQPSYAPNLQPMSQPFCQPSMQPSVQPSQQLSSVPTSQPSSQPSSSPSTNPSAIPSTQPSRQPSSRPSLQPSGQPSAQPVSGPSALPTSQPSSRPTVKPSSSQPSIQPVSYPSSQPSKQPSDSPSTQPTSQPSRAPTSQPSVRPSGVPTAQPSAGPSGFPTGEWATLLDNQAALEGLSVVQDNIWACGGTQGVSAASCVLVSSTTGAVITQYGFTGDTVGSVIMGGDVSRVIVNGRTTDNSTVSSAVANCRIEQSQLTCSVKSFVNAQFTSSVYIPFTNQVAYVGQFNNKAVLSITNNDVSTVRSFTYSTSYMKSIQFRKVASLTNFIGAFVVGTSVTNNVALSNNIVLGWIRVDTGTMVATYFAPVVGNFVGTSQLVNALAVEPSGPDTFIGGGLEVNSIQGMQAYLMRTNALYRSISYAVRFVNQVTSSGRRFLSESNTAHGSVKGMVYVDSLLFVILDDIRVTNSGNTTNLSIVKVNPSSGAVGAHVSVSAPNCNFVLH